MSKKRIKKIRERILKSGFPSEVEIGTVLRKDGWLVGNQWPYRDKNTGKIRPVDILAMKFGFPQSWLVISLLIECKKRRKGEWIFHSQEKEKEFLPLLGSFSDFLEKIGGTTISEKITDWTPKAIMASKLSGLHLLDKTIRIGVFSITPEGKDDFHEAVIQIISALEGMKESMKSFINFPAIVFTGDMFEYYQENRDTKIQPINHIQFITFVPATKGMYPCLIDVVRKSYFNEYLSMVNRDFSIFSQLMNGKLLVKRKK